MYLKVCGSNFNLWARYCSVIMPWLKNTYCFLGFFTQVQRVCHVENVELIYLRLLGVVNNKIIMGNLFSNLLHFFSQKNDWYNDMLLWRTFDVNISVVLPFEVLIKVSPAIKVSWTLHKDAFWHNLRLYELHTLISLINVKSRLLILKKKMPSRPVF